MTDKKILEINIDDGEFKKFAEEFDKFKAEVAKVPGAWAEVSKWARQMKSDFETVNKRLNEQKQQQNKKAATGEGYSLDMAWQSISANSRKFYEHIKGSTLSLMKWAGLTSVFSAILGAGGLFGIMRMSQTVSQGRQTAGGLGVSYGEAKAFGTAFGRLGDTAPILSGFYSAMHGAQGRSTLNSVLGPNAGARLRGKDASSAFVEAYPDILRILRSAPPGQLQETIDAYHLGELGITLEKAKSMLGLSADETQEMLGTNADLAKRLNLSPEDQRNYRDFLDQTNRARDEMETHFVCGLAHLAEPLGKVADASAHLFEAFMTGKNSSVPHYMEMLNSGLKWLDEKIKDGHVEQWGAQLKGAVKEFGRLLDEMKTSDPTTGAFGQAPQSAGQGKANRWLNMIRRVITGREAPPQHANLDWAARRGRGSGALPSASAQPGFRSRIPLDPWLSGPEQTRANEMAKSGASQADIVAEVMKMDPGMSHHGAIDVARRAANSGGATDISGQSTFRRKGERINPDYFIMHWTGGRGTPQSVMNTLNQRGLGVHYVMDRNGRIFQTLPEGSRGAHIMRSPNTSASNDNALGMEIIATSDKDYTPEQIEAAAIFARQKAAQYGFPVSHIMGHGEVNPGHKQAAEGLAPASRARSMGANPQLQGGGQRRVEIQHDDSSTHIEAKSSPFGGLPNPTSVNWSAAQPRGAH